MIARTLKLNGIDFRVVATEAVNMDFLDIMELNLVVDMDNEAGVMLAQQTDEYDYNNTVLFVTHDGKEYMCEIDYVDFSEGAGTWSFATVATAGISLIAGEQKETNNITDAMAVEMIDDFIEKEMAHYRDKNKSLKKQKFRDFISSIRAVLVVSNNNQGASNEEA